MAYCVCVLKSECNLLAEWAAGHIATLNIMNGDEAACHLIGKPLNCCFENVCRLSAQSSGCKLHSNVSCCSSMCHRFEVKSSVL